MNNIVYKNTMLLIGVRIINPFLSFILTVCISRILGPEILGKYSYILALSGMFISVSQIGMQGYIIKEISAHKEKSSSYLLHSIYLSSIAGVIAICILLGSANYFSATLDMKVPIIIMSFCILPGIVTYYIECVFMAFEKMNYIFYISILPTFVRVLFSILAIYFGAGLYHIILIFALSSIFHLGLSLFIYNKYISRIKLLFNMNVFMELLKNAPTFLFLTIVSVLSWRIDIIMLTKMSNLSQVGFYSVAYKMFEILMIIPQGWMKSSYPQISRSYIINKMEFRNVVIETSRYLSYYLFTTAVVIYLLGDYIIKIIYGDKYIESIGILQLLVFGLIPWGGARISGYLLVASGNQRYDLMSSIVATVVNISSNIILIPKYGGVGAALSTLISFTVFFVFEISFVYVRIIKINIYKIILKPIILSLILYALICIIIYNPYYIILFVSIISLMLCLWQNKIQILFGNIRNCFK